MIDWHCHILPGIDDGAADMEHSLAMATALAAAGFTDVYCTPHMIRGCYEVGNDEVRQLVSKLQEHLDAARILLTLHSGREYYLDEYLLTYLEEPLTLDNDRSILVEIPPRITADMVRQLLYAVVKSGFTPVIAHPERCSLLEPATRRTSESSFFTAMKKIFVGKTDYRQDLTQFASTGNHLLDYLRELGCSFQGNLGSFTGFYGRQVKDVAEALRRTGIYDRYGSDLHAPEHVSRILQQAHTR